MEFPASPDEGVETETSIDVMHEETKKASTLIFETAFVIVACCRLHNGLIELNSMPAKLFVAAKKSCKKTAHSANKSCFMLNCTFVIKKINNMLVEKVLEK